MYTIDCPYCEYTNKIDNDFVSDNTLEDFYLNCKNCGKKFIVFKEYEPSFSAREVECEIQGDHDYKPCDINSGSNCIQDYGIAFCARENCMKKHYTFDEGLRKRSLDLFSFWKHNIPQQIKDGLKKEHLESFKKWKEK